MHYKLCREGAPTYVFSPPLLGVISSIILAKWATEGTFTYIYMGEYEYVCRCLCDSASGFMSVIIVMYVCVCACECTHVFFIVCICIFHVYVYCTIPKRKSSLLLLFDFICIPLSHNCFGFTRSILKVLSFSLYRKARTACRGDEASTYFQR